MIVANIFDFIDGKVAIETGLISKFGGFWDSVIDRFSDLALSVGLICLYASLGRTDYVLITSVAMVFATMTSYTRARAESLIAKCKVGFMERPERIVLFMIGAFTNRMAAVMWVIGVLSVVTVVNRIYYTYLELNGRPQPRRAACSRPLRARVLLDRRARDVRLRPVGDRDSGVRLAHAARLAGRSDRDGRRVHAKQRGPPILRFVNGSTRPASDRSNAGSAPRRCLPRRRARARSTRRAAACGWPGRRRPCRSPASW